MLFVSSHNILLLLSPSGMIPQARLFGDGKTFGILTRTIGGIILSHCFMPLLSCVTGSFVGVTWNLERAGPRNLASVPRLLGFWKLFGIVLRAAVLFLFLQFAWDAYVISLFLEYFIIGCRVIQDFGLCKLEYFDNSYDVTIATNSLPDLYLPKMKNALFVAPEFNGLSCACAV